MWLTLLQKAKQTMNKTWQQPLPQKMLDTMPPLAMWGLLRVGKLMHKLKMKSLLTLQLQHMLSTCLLALQVRLLHQLLQHPPVAQATTMPLE